MHAFLTNLFTNWASFYSNQAVVRTFIGFAHVGALLVGGGGAISADRATLVAIRSGSGNARLEQLKNMKGTHRLVLFGLIIATVSGAMLFAADYETYMYSKMFWTKISLFLVLVGNGAMLLRAGRLAEAGDERGWIWLKRTSVASVALWLLTTFVGAALPNIG